MLNLISPELSFSLKRRRLECWLVKEAQKAIMEMDIPEEEKTQMSKEWDNYFLEYMHEYNQYQKTQLDKIIYEALTILN
ncbi:MAG: hypothetical protein ABIE36_03055 [Candidatus Diapherotrites archaeon]